MLTLRTDQITAFRHQILGSRALDQVLGRLVDLGYIEAEEVDREGGDEARALREQVHRDLLTADRHGIRSEDGYLQFVSYRFEFDESWQNWPSVAKAFSEDSGEERRFLDAIYSALASPLAE